MSKVLEKS